ncbi:cytochrome c553 [Methylocaldum marinum]|uniref:Cytochrome c553 n=1 Tax=Methylocaldum marinum TaxID=1432792 RepID=A0A250KVH1_9GAMM|nr:c-type cytochrome [Methylocaldum marinum]BBA35673.1 cytochrome c553 [Methylocaldum marinum]
MKTGYVLAGVLLAAVNGPGAAEPSTRLAWTPETLAFVRNGNADRGEVLAEACEGCHAATPENADSEFPYLQGQLANYLYKQLQDYKTGSRSNEIMVGISAGMSDEDMADVSAWYRRQPAAPARKVDEVSDAARALVNRGDSTRMLAPCAVCHGSSGHGQAQDTPALAAQKATYLEQTMLAYKSGARHNDIYRRMRLIVQQLSDEEIRQLARYYAGLEH